MSTLQSFLSYSLRRQRPIRVMLVDEEGRASHMNITVQSIEEGAITFLSARNRRQPRRLAMGSLLAAGYARGDAGDALPGPEKEKKD